MTTLTQPLQLACAEPARQRRPIALRRGAILRLAGARGTVVRVTRGGVWITEERRLADTVLTGGHAHRIAGDGRVVAAAESNARVVLEWPAHAKPPQAEIACAEGEPGIALIPASTAVAGWLRAFVDALVAPDTRDRGNPFAPDAVRDRLAAHVPLLRA